MKILLLFLICFPICASEMKDVVFAKTKAKDLKMDIYLPSGNKVNRPALMWIHGGGWKRGDRSNCSLKWLTQHGFVVASISYRFSHEAKFPAQIHDCKAALRFLKANADKYGIDKTKIAVGGASAGGHLAALMATTSGDKYFDGKLGDYPNQITDTPAVIDFYGATDFLLRSKVQPDKTDKKGGVVFELLGAAVSENKELARKSSATYQVSANSAPLLIFHGDQDKVVLLPQSERIHQVYQSFDLISELHVLKGAGHGGKVFSSNKTKKLIIDFLNKHI